MALKVSDISVFRSEKPVSEKKTNVFPTVMRTEHSVSYQIFIIRGMVLNFHLCMDCVLYTGGFAASSSAPSAAVLYLWLDYKVKLLLARELFSPRL